MSTTVTYKGNTIATLTNQTKTLNTAGKWMESDVVITDSGSGSGSAITIVDTIDEHGGTNREIVAVSLADDTVTPEVLLDGYTAHNALGQAIVGTATGGGSVDMPTFTVTWDDNWDHIVSVTCDKTFTECFNYFEYDYKALAQVIETDQSHTAEYIECGYLYATGSSQLDYTVIYSLQAQYDIQYTSDSQITIISPSGNSEVINITSNGTYVPEKMSVSEINVNVPSSAPTLQSKTGIAPTESSQTIQPDSGYDGLSSVQINGVSSNYVGSGVARKSSSDLTASGATVTVPAGYYESQATKTIPTGSATAPASISGTAATVSTGTNTLTLSKSVSVTPSVTAGYVSGGTAGDSSVSLTANVTTKAAATYTPSTQTQTIAADQYLTGAQTINPIPSQYIVPTGNKEITENGSNIDVAAFSTVSVNVSSSGGIVITEEANATGTTAVITADSVTTLTTKSITQNGTYSASSDNADGYSSVTVNVSGGSPSATQHSIYFEFSDSTNTTIPVYYDDPLLGTMITAYEPTTYGGKTVTLAQLDGVTWYEPSVIPINTQLIDFTKVSSDKALDNDGSEISQQWYYLSDYTAVERGMTFSYTAGIWTYIGFYNSSKVALDTIYVYSDGTEDQSDSNIAHGTLSGNKLPSGVAYVRIASTGDNSSRMSLIRTA